MPNDYSIQNNMDNSDSLIVQLKAHSTVTIEYMDYGNEVEEPTGVEFP
jgi:hypothetical protein